ncbi:MAG: S8 family serine peptidase [Phycisphaerales bacterium]|nr:S8 family serine peptidase [Phycisphaerales bacterium]
MLLGSVPSVLAADLGAAVASPATSQHVRIFAGKAEPLLVDAAHRLAVRAADAKVVETALIAIGAGGVEPTGLDGWWFASVPKTMSIEAASAALADQPGVEFVSPVFVDYRGGPLWIGAQMLVGRDANVDLGVAAERVTTLMAGIEAITASTRNGLDLLAQANALAKMPGVRFAEPDWAFSGTGALTPNDALYPQQWAMNQANNWDMNAPQAWDTTTGSSAIITVIIDVGTDLTHPDLNLATGIDTTGSPALLGAPGNTCDKHGTAVAGCVSAKINNSIGCVGIAPNTRSASARTFVSNLSCNGSWNSSASYTVSTLNFAQSSGARVTNNSNYYGFTSAAIESAYATTYAAGIVHFASNGNNGTSSIAYPASVPFVNGIAALASSGARAGFSQYGVGTDFSAPGASVISTDIAGADGYVAGDYATVSGTSFASPYAAGVAALILSKNSTLTAAQVEGIMQTSSRDLGLVGYDTDFGWGLVNAQAALAATPTSCIADFDGINGIDTNDIFSFLNAWFAGSPTADVDGLAGLAPADVFYFLNSWFAGC